MKKVFCLVMGLLLLVGCATTVNEPASKLILKNDDHLSGELSQMKGGALSVKHKHINGLSVKWDGIKSIETEGPVLIELKNGDLLNGSLMKGEDGKLRVVSEGAEAREIPYDEIFAINVVPAWKGELTITVSRVRGNTESNNMDTMFTTERESRYSIISFKGNYNYGDSEDGLVKRNGSAGGKYGYKFHPRLYAFVSSGVSYDYFTNIDLRSSVGAGLGWKTIDAPGISLNLELGSQYTTDRYRLNWQELDDEYAEGTGALEFNKTITGWMSFKQTATFSVPFDEVEHLRAEALSMLDLKVTDILSAKFGYKVRSNQNPPDGVKRNDTEVFAGISLKY